MTDSLSNWQIDMSRSELSGESSWWGLMSYRRSIWRVAWWCDVMWCDVTWYNVAWDIGNIKNMLGSCGGWWIVIRLKRHVKKRRKRRVWRAEDSSRILLKRKMKIWSIKKFRGALKSASRLPFCPVATPLSSLLDHIIPHHVPSSCAIMTHHTSLGLCPIALSCDPASINLSIRLSSYLAV